MQNIFIYLFCLHEYIITGLGVEVNYALDCYIHKNQKGTSIFFNIICQS